jgi:hypothetical protein
LWGSLQRAVDGVLAQITLRDLLRDEAQMKEWLDSRPVRISPDIQPVDRD